VAVRRPEAQVARRGGRQEAEAGARRGARVCARACGGGGRRRGRPRRARRGRRRRAWKPCSRIGRRGGRARRRQAGRREPGGRGGIFGGRARGGGRGAGARKGGPRACAGPGCARDPDSFVGMQARRALCASGQAGKRGLPARSPAPHGRMCPALTCRTSARAVLAGLYACEVAQAGGHAALRARGSHNAALSYWLWPDTTPCAWFVTLPFRRRRRPEPRRVAARGAGRDDLRDRARAARGRGGRGRARGQGQGRGARGHRQGAPPWLQPHAARTRLCLVMPCVGSSAGRVPSAAAPCGPGPRRALSGPLLPACAVPALLWSCIGP